MSPSATTAEEAGACGAGSFPPAAAQPDQAAADLSAMCLLLAHEMRTPLSAIIGACELALAGPAGGAGQGVQALLRDIARAARRLDGTATSLAHWQLTTPPSAAAVAWVDLQSACAEAGLAPTSTAVTGTAVRAERSRLHAALTCAGRWLGRGGGAIAVLVGVRPGCGEVGRQTVLRLDGGIVAEEVGDLGRLDLVLCRLLVEAQGGHLVEGGVTLELCWPAQPAVAACPAIDPGDFSA